MSSHDTEDISTNEHTEDSYLTTDPLVLYVNSSDLSVQNDNENSDSVNKTPDENEKTNARQENRPFSCNVCDKTFKRRGHLKVHLFTHNDEKSYECKVCNKSFFHSYFLNQHKKIHNSEKVFSCESCHKKFSVRRYFVRHLRSHKLKKYKCDACDFACGKLGGINNHVKRHTMGYSRCELCNMHFCYETSIRLHECNKCDIRRFHCHLCTRVFKTFRELDLHVAATHNNERRFVCGICHSGFNYKNMLDFHMETHVDEAEKKHSCPKCSKKFKFERLMKTHLRLHSRFPRKRKPSTENLDSESRADQNPTNSQNYAKIGYLNIEGSVDANQLAYFVPMKDAKFICDICLKCFKAKHKFKLHYRTHTGEKPYECEVCHRCFNGRSDMKRHFRIHTGERNYPCTNCDKRYTRKSFLNDHLKKCIAIPRIVKVFSEFQDSASSQG